MTAPTGDPLAARRRRRALAHNRRRLDRRIAGCASALASPPPSSPSPPCQPRAASAATTMPRPAADDPGRRRPRRRPPTAAAIATTGRRRRRPAGRVAAGAPFPDGALRGQRAAGTITYLSGFDFAATASIIDVVVADEAGYFEDLCLDVELQPSFSTANYPIVAAATPSSRPAGRSARSSTSPPPTRPISSRSRSRAGRRSTG